jgi:hypothetical protein
MRSFIKAVLRISLFIAVVAAAVSTARELAAGQAVLLEMGGALSILMLAPFWKRAEGRLAANPAPSAVLPAVLAALVVMLSISTLFPRHTVLFQPPGILPMAAAAGTACAFAATAVYARLDRTGFFKAVPLLVLLAAAAAVFMAFLLAAAVEWTIIAPETRGAPIDYSFLWLSPAGAAAGLGTLLALGTAEGRTRDAVSISLMLPPITAGICGLVR